ncbi:zinc finger MYM-type protein 1-like [Spea bombifrons]|uniref:zinc finger MYM-type protein 1-like n=1 Tax=Spea bombifrons TaxID=233779 RepID=UPI00234AF3C3|nr:zinc finger MYM-type protein 1-like [Spea bombifrons]
MDIRKFFTNKSSQASTSSSDTCKQKEIPESPVLHHFVETENVYAETVSLEAVDLMSDSSDGEEDHASVPAIKTIEDVNSKSKTYTKRKCISLPADEQKTLRTAVVPNQPDYKTIPAQTIVTQKAKKRVLNFQECWYENFPWLHYSFALEGVLCFYCAKAAVLNLTHLERNTEPAFVCMGFKNWKKAIEKFKKHQSCSAHTYSMKQLLHHKGSQPINAQLSLQIQQQQNDAWLCLIKIVQTIALLAKQGLPLRGHDDNDGNFKQFLLARADDLPYLKKWITHKMEYMSPDIQNEILQLLSHSVLHLIRKKIGNNAFAVIVDGTQDISGQEQESFCIRYVDQDFYPHEDFIGLYQVDETSGSAIAKIVKDALCRNGLCMSMLRGQTYDGASNMAGKYHGAQALIRQEQPLAIYVHCGAHCTNLVMQAAAHQCPIMEDALMCVQDLGNLFGQSVKCRTTFSEIVQREAEGPLKVIHIKPLCPTRWTVRVKSVKKVLDNYELILQTLEEFANSRGSGDVHSRARGLLQQFRQGKILLGLQISLTIMEILECLNKALQGNEQTISGLLASVQHTHDAIQKLRCDTSFERLLTANMHLVEKYQLKEVNVPRQPKVPKRLQHGPTEQFHAKTVKEYYCPQYFQLIDAILTQLMQRFDQEGLLIYEKLEQCLLTGQASEGLLQYPEIEHNLLSAQITTLSSVHKYTSVSEAVEILRKMPARERCFFSEVEKMVRILLTVPASSCEAERSFSALRRLKTWLRSTMTQKRLNHVAICNIHRDIMDELELEAIAKEFAMRCDRRKKVFGF